jgi:hypothetical protein
VEKKKGSLRRGVLCLGADEIHLAPDPDPGCGSVGGVEEGGLPTRRRLRASSSAAGLLPARAPRSSTAELRDPPPPPSSFPVRGCWALVGGAEPVDGGKGNPQAAAALELHGRDGGNERDRGRG